MTGFRPARLDGDRDALLALWQQVFGDEEPFVTRCLRVFAGPGQVYVAQGAKGIEAMLSAVPCRLDDGWKGVYLYALATEPAVRGRGIMSGLMAYAERAEHAKGAEFAALIPASEGLYAYYGARGYAQRVLLRRYEISLRAESSIQVELEDPAAERLEALRRRWLAVPRVVFEGLRAGVVAADMAEAGLRLAEAATGYAVWHSGTEGLQVPELAADDDLAAMALLNALAAQTGQGRAVATLPAGCPLLEGLAHTVTPCGLVKSLGGRPLPQNLYLRFALDEAEV